MAARARLSPLWESVGGDLDVRTVARIDGLDGQFTPSSAKIDSSRLALGLDSELHLSDRVFAHVRYDTTQSESFSNHTGWAGITIAF